MNPRHTVTRRRIPALAVAGAAALTLAACGGGGGFDDTGDDATGAGGGGGGEALEILIGSSGEAETKAVEEAVDAWSQESGVEATVTTAADLPQQLSQGFAADSPPDVFYVSTDHFAGYAANGFLEPYAGDLSNADDFYPTLRESFTYDDQFYCAPKDWSTLALFINNEQWSKAGLTDDDVPTTWEELQSVASRLSESEKPGLAFSAEWPRVGAFMAQAGGGLVGEDGEAIVDSPENAEALTYVQDLLSSGAASYAADLGAGWGGEAFGTGTPMAIEGNWLIGALANDWPDVDYRVVPLPEGPSGPGTLQFTNCWGVAADGGSIEQAVSLVEHLTSADQQMRFATAFGVMPSLESVADRWTEEFPEQAPFLEHADAAQGYPVVEGASDFISEFNAQLEGLGNGDVQGMLTSLQSTLEAVLADSQQ